MKKKLFVMLITVLSFVLLMLTACTTSTATSSKGGTQTPAGPIIYTAGQFSRIPCYWIGTQKTDLSTTLGEIKAMTIYNGTIYTAGMVNNENDETEACFYTGTEKTVLDTIGAGFLGPVANAIFVNENGVYTAGLDQDDNGCYWHGTTKTLLQNGDGASGLARVNAIVALNTTTIVTAGRDNAGYACIWVNGDSVTRLSNSTANTGSDNAIATSLFIYNNQSIYIGGIDSSGNACYWVGPSDKQILGFGHVLSIFVSNGTVYTSGVYSAAAFEEWGEGNHRPAYWEGTTLVTLDYPANRPRCRAYSIWVNEGTIYTAGKENSYGDPIYWIGSEISLYDTGGIGNGVINSIIVQ